MPSGRRDPRAGRPLSGVPRLPLGAERPASARAPSPARPLQARPAARPRATPRPALLPLLRWPLLLALAVTALRLVGELRRWSPDYFNRIPGGGLSPLGIVWLIPLVGLYFGWRLQRQGYRPPSLLRAALPPPLALALGAGALLLLDRLRTHSQLRPLSWQEWLAMWAVASVLAAAVAYASWPTLGRPLLAYALATRLAVAAVMALAIHRNWGTHYDLPPPRFPAMPPLQRWLWTGLLPQLTIWVAITVCLGALFGALGWLAASEYARLRGRR